MLINIFKCTEGISDNLTDSFLYQDCTTFCYSGTHKNFAVITFLIIVFCLPLMIINRPNLEIIQKSLSLRTKPRYLYILSLIQFSLVISNKTLKAFDENINGVVIIFILGVLLTLTIFMKPYNYKRAYISQLISISLAIWTISTTTVFRNFSEMSAWIIVECVGIAFLGLIGFYFLKKSKEFLVSTKGRDISTLFLFQFCKNYEKYIKDPQSLHFSKHEKKIKY